jgi:hypothetical protein
MKARSIALTPEEQADLELIVRRPTSAARDVFRAGVIFARGGRVQQRRDRGGHEDASGYGE